MERHYPESWDFRGEVKKYEGLSFTKTTLLDKSVIFVHTVAPSFQLEVFQVPGGPHFCDWTARIVAGTGRDPTLAGFGSKDQTAAFAAYYHKTFAKAARSVVMQWHNWASRYGDDVASLYQAVKEIEKVPMNVRTGEKR